MKELPILFSTPMVQANLDGRKTMTRRIVKPQPSNGLQKGAGDPGWYDTDYECTFHTGKYIKCPYGQPGDLLWVRETWCLPSLFDGFEKDYYFKAGFSVSDIKDRNASQNWRPSIHMPKAAARIWSQVEEIRVERLQDISEEDAISEGILPAENSKSLFLYYDKYSMKLLAGGEMKTKFVNGEKVRIGAGYTGALSSFRSLWTYINGPESWDANPWVWVVMYKILSTSGKPELETLNLKPETAKL